jgi:aminoglycoside phosphotransferase (APT) family kinase protein
VVSDLVANSTSRRREATDERLCSLHGDFHLDQLVASGNGPVLVDLDSMVHGPPEIDLAEFLVDLALRGLPEGVAGQVADGLLSSYTAATGTGIDAALLDICATAEFVNRCYRHLRRHTPGWQQDLEAELGRHGEVTTLLRG